MGRAWGRAACLTAFLALTAAADLSVAPSVHKPAPKPEPPGSTAPLVNVTLYGEALCPYCAAFLKGPGADLLGNKFLRRIAVFRYVAWGNAKRALGGPECQHGPAECRLNRLINCAAELRPEQTAWFPFVRCLADSVGIRSVEGEVGSCAAGAGIDADALRACAEGPAGAALEAAAEKETAKLDPPHQGVPWVTVNGITIGDDTDLLWRYICIAYTGPRPKTCFRPPPEDSNGHHSGRHGGRFELSAGLVGGVAGVVALAGVLAWGAARSADALRRRRQQGSDAEASLLVEPAVSFSIPDHTAAGPPPGRALRFHSLHMPGPGSYRTLRLPP